jgi:hypothetical protein
MRVYRLPTRSVNRAGWQRAKGTTAMVGSPAGDYLVCKRQDPAEPEHCPTCLRRPPAAMPSVVPPLGAPSAASPARVGGKEVAISGVGAVRTTARQHSDGGA